MLNLPPCNSSIKELENRLRHHVVSLSVEIGDRSLGAGQGLDRAADYITAEFASSGLKVKSQPYSYRRKQVRNLVASSDFEDAQAYFVVGAHYDTVPGVAGADDNASGVAVLLALAERLAAHPPAVPVRLVAFTLEEAPYYMTRWQGSRVFIKEAKRKKDQILGAVILEMVGYTSARQEYPFLLRRAGYPKHGRFIGLVGDWKSRSFGRIVCEGFRANLNLPTESLFVPFKGWPLPVARLSDHSSFWDHRLPAVMVTDTAFLRNPNYHTPRDTIDTLDFPFMAQVVQGLDLAIRRLCSDYSAQVPS